MSPQKHHVGVASGAATESWSLGAHGAYIWSGEKVCVGSLATEAGIFERKTEGFSQKKCSSEAQQYQQWAKSSE